MITNREVTVRLRFCGFEASLSILHVPNSFEASLLPSSSWLVKESERLRLYPSGSTLGNEKPTHSFDINMMCHNMAGLPVRGQTLHQYHHFSMCHHSDIDLISYFISLWEGALFPFSTLQREVRGHKPVATT